MARWENNPQGLKDELDKRSLKVSTGAGMRTDFVDPRQRAGVIEDHMKLVRFIPDSDVTTKDQHRRQLIAASGSVIRLPISLNVVAISR